MGFQISLCKFHKISLIEKLLEGKSVTLWDELAEHKAVSQKASFLFFNGSYFLFHRSPLWASKYHFPNSRSTVLAKTSWGESCISVRWINRTQSSFSESFFSIFNGRYFPFHHSSLRASKYLFAYSKRPVLVNGFLRGKLYLCEMN